MKAFVDRWKQSTCHNKTGYPIPIVEVNESGHILHLCMPIVIVLCLVCVDLLDYCCMLLKSFTSGL